MFSICFQIIELNLSIGLGTPNHRRLEPRVIVDPQDHLVLKQAEAITQEKVAKSQLYLRTSNEGHSNTD